MRIVIARTQCSVEEWTHVVVPLEMDRLGIIRRKHKRHYPLFIDGLSPNFFSIEADAGKQVWVQAIIKTAVNIRISIL